ncbi:MAG: hypothetical protein IJ513_04755 [Bacteroidaceae bacterium]|nr:hypothetical protein [Bacteroidales bacterium]MBQ3244118.1 hypothetical protein [Bacteroidaceae bacterium]MBQ8694936.1 hypothetical protein [Bacteroidaceae bacterium]
MGCSNYPQCRFTLNK